MNGEEIFYLKRNIRPHRKELIEVVDTVNIIF